MNCDNPNCRFAAASMAKAPCNQCRDQLRSRKNRAQSNKETSKTVPTKKEKAAAIKAQVQADKEKLIHLVRSKAEHDISHWQQLLEAKPVNDKSWVDFLADATHICQEDGFNQGNGKIISVDMGGVLTEELVRTCLIKKSYLDNQQWLLISRVKRDSIVALTSYAIGLCMKLVPADVSYQQAWLDGYLVEEATDKKNSMHKLGAYLHYDDRQDIVSDIIQAGLNAVLIPTNKRNQIPALTGTDLQEWLSLHITDKQ